MALVPAVAWAEPMWPLSTASSQGRSIQFLWWLLMSLAGVVLVGILGWLLIIIVRFRARPGAPDPTPSYGNRRIEIGWTAIPIAILVVVFVFMVRTMNAATAIGPDAYDITVVGHQWWWEFRYPSNVAAANELHVPAGRQVRLSLQSADVVHSFWVPALNGKEQAIPGTNNLWTFTVDSPQKFDGACAEYCGNQHGWMRLEVTADDASAFTTWVATQQAPASASVLAAHQDAVKLYSDNACGGCHTINGLSGAKVAPDLTHIGSRATLGAGVLPNTPDNMVTWLLDPQAYKPGSFMPNFHFTNQQASQLAAFLEDLK
ncbi:MAG: cytochrome c oxidase subunit II [Chloroflexi bacterium]|nr:cytochrome c oxidase subunit II [Chloroflexota bacterium]